MKLNMIALVTVFASAGTLAQAQTPDTIGITNLNNRIDDMTIAANKDIALGNDPNRFGNPEFRPGLSGSASLSYSGKTGNNKSQDVSAGARLRYASGALVQTIGLAVDYSDADDVKSKEDYFVVYDANYYFTDKFYGFVLGRALSNGLADTAAENATDAFIGFGPGYRILNSPTVTWRVQAGVGQSYLKDGADNSETELGGIASSRLFYSFNDNVFLTDDIDVLRTKSSLRVNNDIGINVKMSDVIATRISYLTEYNDARAIRADNKLGVSIVFGF